MDKVSPNQTDSGDPPIPDLERGQLHAVPTESANANSKSKALSQDDIQRAQPQHPWWKTRRAIIIFFVIIIIALVATIGGILGSQKRKRDDVSESKTESGLQGESDFELLPSNSTPPLPTQPEVEPPEVEPEVKVEQQWVKVGQELDGEDANDLSGRSVSLSADGNIVAIGAESNDGSGVDAGHVRVFQRHDSKWIQIGHDINGESAGDISGATVSLSADGKIVAIGAFKNDGSGGEDSGHVRVYRLDGSKWTKVGQDIDGEGAGDYSGASVSLSADGMTVAVGATGNNGKNGVNSGHVRVYRLVGTIWTKIGQDIDGEDANDLSGKAVSLSADGMTVAIGATYNDGNAIDSGHVRVYRLFGTIWTKIGQDIDGEAANDLSGRAVSLSADGNIVAIGATGNDGNGGVDSGHVRVYNFDGSVWTKIGQDIDGDRAGVASGFVSLSSDGTTVAVGAPNYNENGVNSGQVRVYRHDGASWIQFGQDIYGENAGDVLGDETSVSLSADGTTVAVGALGNDGRNGVNSGRVRVYEIKPFLL